MKIRQYLRQFFSNWPAKILSLTAAIVLFLFYRVNTLEERFFSTKLEVRLPAGFAIAATYPRSARITLRGGQDTIYPILEEDVVAYVDLERHQSEGVFGVPVKVEKTGTALDVEPLEVRVEPGEVTITLEREIQKSLEVTPRIGGKTARGYRLVEYTMTPSDVEVNGPASHVEPIAEVTTEEIDLSGRSESFTSRVRLMLNDPFVEPIGESVVEFHGIIEEELITRTFDGVYVVSANVPAAYRLLTGMPQGAVKVQGGLLAVERLRSTQFRLVVDCTQVQNEGTMTVSVRLVDAPPEVSVISYSPRQISLEFESVDLGPVEAEAGERE